jgi:hypothetical protein
MIRAQPYDDTDVRAFLMPPADCAAPCFLGIRPRVTAVQKAVKLLQQHEWIGEVDDFDPIPRTDSRSVIFATRVDWTWNGQQPAWLGPEQDSMLFFYPTVGRVDKIIIETGLTVGAVQYVLGRPDVQHFSSRYQVDGYWWTYEASFAAADLTIRIEAPCPAGLVVERGAVEMTFGYLLPEPDQTVTARTVCP